MCHHQRISHEHTTSRSLLGCLRLHRGLRERSDGTALRSQDTGGTLTSEET